MKTLEMMNKCKGNDLKFVTKDMFYNEKLGFRDSRNNPWPSDAFKNINDILKLEWKKAIKKVHFEKAYSECLNNNTAYQIDGMKNSTSTTMSNYGGNVIIETTQNCFCLSDMWIEKVGE